MAATHTSVDRIPLWSWAAPAAASALLVLVLTGIISATAALVVVIASGLLGAAVFASVHHAEVVALRIGEPFGSIVLALAVTVIESSLILSIMLTGGAGGETIARDTVFATVMIVLNGIVGVCLVLGGMRHVEQRFGTDATGAALSVLGTLSVVTLVLPNFTSAAVGPYYSAAQLVVVSIATLALYAVFVFVQTVRHRTYFLEASSSPDDIGEQAPAIQPSNRTAWISAGLLLLSLTAVVLLAKVLAPSLERAIAAVGLPHGFIGVVIAAVVLLPEGISAARAARVNRLQAALNLTLGSALATIGLTIPIVAGAALVFGRGLALGVGQAEMVLLVLTLFISTVTLATGRTTILQGSVHLMIFIVFLLTAIVS
jgi:Ca2+:H+ antiporter